MVEQKIDTHDQNKQQINSINELSENNPFDPSVHLKMGIKYLSPGKDQNILLANSALDTAHKLDPTNDVLVKSFAIAQYELGNFPASIILFAQLSELRELSPKEKVIFASVAYRGGFFDISHAVYSDIGSSVSFDDNSKHAELMNFLNAAFDQAGSLMAARYSSPHKNTASSAEDLPTWAESQKPEEVFIDAVIVEHVVEASNSSGRNLLDGLGLSISRGRTETTTTQSDFSGSYSISKLEDVLSYNLLQNIQYNLNLFMEADSTINLQSSPNVLARLGESSTISRVQTITSLREYVSGSYTQYVPTDVGTKLTVTPLEISDDFVDLDIEVENGSFQQISMDVYTGLNNTPVLQSETVSNKLKAIVPYNQVISLGGISKRSNFEKSGGVQGTTGLPILGKFLSQNTSEETISNTMVFLSARKKNTTEQKIDPEQIFRDIGLKYELVEKIGRAPDRTPKIDINDIL